MTHPGSPSPATPSRWAAVRARVEALGRTIAGGDSLSPDEVRAVLEERARRLARPLTTGPEGESLELVEFELTGEVVAVESRYVVGVGPCGAVALLPGVDPRVAGLTAWRGELLPLLDLRRVVGAREEASGADPAYVVVLGDGTPAFGVGADALRGLARTPAAALCPPVAAAGEGRSFLRGTTADAVLVLAADELIRIPF